ncbi:Uncharacterized conserved protein, DUF2267 family [Jannaschia faecimaris]|uniref:Uncharacterized conserved protein, DUF2267 family n=1 Tax=Jannaschia faecimaris TaxID=1244108 RepID=A0A1H3ST25_9RHOB|nr:DUF2267 domain-containing protein [Jannaschia faecimaris]SDZ40269.1 Uncharacterized conserved protein, DUF2267 family [Jannaschia faecimaris]
MSAQNLEVLDHTVQLTHEWVNELRERIDWPSSRDALRLMRAVLTEVRDHIPHEEVAQLSAQMPLLIRGMFFEGWRPAITPLTDRSAEHFIKAIEARVGQVDGYRGREDIAAVFATIGNRVSDGELRQVRHALPPAIRDFWPTDTLGGD